MRSVEQITGSGGLDSSCCREPLSCAEHTGRCAEKTRGGQGAVYGLKVTNAVAKAQSTTMATAVAGIRAPKMVSERDGAGAPVHAGSVESRAVKAQTRTMMSATRIA